MRGQLTEIGICKNIQQYDVQMTSNYVILLIKFSLNVGNDDYIILCNFDDLIISGLEAEEGGLRTSPPPPRPFPVAGSKKLTGLNFLFPSPIHAIWNRIPRSTSSPSQLCKRIEILISD